MQDAQPPVADGDILAMLRAATRPAHDAIEQRLDLVGHPISADRYVAILRAFLGFYEPFERRLADFPEWSRFEFDLAGRRKTDWIRDDLRALGLGDGEIAAAERCSDLPELPVFACAVGGLYVVEGATLGGQIIERHVQNCLNFNRHKGCRFFSSYGTRVASRWKQTCQFVRDYTASAGVEMLIVRGACHTFESLDRWFDSQLMRL